MEMSDLMSEGQQKGFARATIRVIIGLRRLKMKRLSVVLVLAFLAFPVLARGFSGSWSTTLSLDGAGFTTWNTLELRLAFAGWELRSLSSLSGAGLLSQSLTLKGDLGQIGITAGATFTPVPETNWKAFAIQNLQVQSGFISLEFALGNITFRLTLIAGAGG